MTRHPSLKRTMIRGLRPLPSKPLIPPPNLSRRTIEQMRWILFDEVLADGKTRKDFNEKQLFVADYAFLVVLFHRGEKNADELWTERKRGYQVKFDEEAIDSLAFVILEEKAKGQLESIFPKLAERSQK